jgi:CO/xanthine dehydrogenase FAD-binding subunit
MAALAVALHATCVVWAADGRETRLPALEFFVGAGRTVLGAGDILRAIEVPGEALRWRAAVRQASLTTLGRSAALLIATCTADGFELTIAAATAVPRQVSFAGWPGREELAVRIDEVVPDWFDDVHGRPAWRRRMTHILAAELCVVLMGK